MSTVHLLFPHQLFEDTTALNKSDVVYLVEEHLFFRQYKFHQQKLVFHRATMKNYQSELKEKGFEVNYVPATSERCDVRKLIAEIDDDVDTIRYYDPVDDWLKKRIESAAKKKGLQTDCIPDSPLFINQPEDLQPFFATTKKKYFQTSFYIAERKRLGIMLEGDDEPAGGKWSFDAENRKKFPAKKQAPPIQFPDKTEAFTEAVEYVSNNFADHFGEIKSQPFYPLNRKESVAWLDQFLEQRFHEFGDYEDAIVKEHLILNHSVLSPLINVGLLTPMEVVNKALDFAQKNDVPINSLEGFVRQIIGWREFIRGMYVARGTDMRTTNFWEFKRKIPPSFYDGSTGIPPIDTTIKKVLKTGYCHHIERLMILGNFMLLCEFDPDEVYRWFMELFIDSYDWVMVPNVYAMSQFADGGLMTTKPYLSGSNYVRKMSNYPKGDWQEIWDALFWSFMDKHHDFFKKNPRLNMLLSGWFKKSAEHRAEVVKKAEDFRNSLDS